MGAATPPFPRRGIRFSVSSFLSPRAVGGPMNSNKTCVSIGVIVLCLVGAIQGYSQSSGSIIGSVLDPTGARIPGASVSLDDRNSGGQRTAETNATGCYNVTAVQPSHQAMR